MNIVALKNKIVRGVIEYQRTLELGREIKEIMDKLKKLKLLNGDLGR